MQGMITGMLAPVGYLAGTLLECFSYNSKSKQKDKGIGVIRVYDARYERVEKYIDIGIVIS